MRLNDANIKSFIVDPTMKKRQVKIPRGRTQKRVERLDTSL